MMAVFGQKSGKDDGVVFSPGGRRTGNDLEDPKWSMNHSQ